MSGAWTKRPARGNLGSEPGTETVVGGPHGQEIHLVWPPWGLLLLVYKRNVKSVVNNIKNQEVFRENLDTQLLLNRKPWPQ